MNTRTIPQDHYEKSVTIADMLSARDERAAAKSAFLKQYGVNTVCFSMNIAGPKKQSILIRRGFQEGQRLLKEYLSYSSIAITAEKLLESPCGDYYILGTDASADRLKRLCVELEEGTELGRLFDLDICQADGRPVGREELGLPARKCLLCGNPAKVCGRSRTHSVESLQNETTRILREYFETRCVRRAAEFAVRALLFEVCTTPKPGLVDLNNNGAHKDMDLFSFLSSSASLFPYFEQCARIGFQTTSSAPESTFSQLRFPGKSAEQEMMRATGGVNTHKGAIFSLGILCGALGRCAASNLFIEKTKHVPQPFGSVNAKQICDEAARMTNGILEELSESKNRLTAGEQQFRDHGLTGVRGIVAGGYEPVLNTALPLLKKCLSKGSSINDAGSIVLFHLLAVVDDSNLIRRGGFECQQNLRRTLFKLAQETPLPAKTYLLDLDREFIEKNLSPGGCADLLAAAYFLLFVENTVS